MARIINNDISQLGLLVISIIVYFYTIVPVYERDLIKKQYEETYTETKYLIKENTKARLEKCVTDFLYSNFLFSSEIKQNNVQYNKQFDLGINIMKGCLGNEKNEKLYELLREKDKKKFIESVNNFVDKFTYDIDKRSYKFKNARAYIKNRYKNNTSKVGDLASDFNVKVRHSYNELIFE